MKCGICGNNKTKKFFNLGKQAPSDAFLYSTSEFKKEKKYPLGLEFCSKCLLVQLTYSVDPAKLFSTYVYTTGSNNSLIAHFNELATLLVTDYNLKSSDLVIDIGSNDGTFLTAFRKHNVKILGIDPSSVAREAKNRGIPTVIDFFNEKVAVKVVKSYGLARLVTASNVFAHVPEVNSFMAGVKALLTTDGVFVSESHYLVDIVQKTQYDSIYHEHLRYYSLSALMSLFKLHGMEIFRVERIPMHNGSIRVYAGRIGQHKIHISVAKTLALEKRLKLNTLLTLKKFARDSNRHCRELKKIITKITGAHKRVVGLGAPAKGNTLLQACKLGPSTISFLADKSKLKIGTYSPGSHIPVVPDELLIKEQPEFALILSWNIVPELIKKLKTSGFKGKFIIPLPKPKIV